MIDISHIRRSEIMKAIERCACGDNLTDLRAKLRETGEITDPMIFQTMMLRAERFAP